MNSDFSDRKGEDKPIPNVAKQPPVFGVKGLGGRLAQAALLKRLNQARGVLLFVGAITLIYNFNLYMNADAELNLEIAKLGPNKQVNLRSYAEILMFLYIFTTVPS